MRTAFSLLVFINLFLLADLIQSQELSAVWPKQEQVMPDAEIEFQWNPAQNAISYNLEVYSDEELTTLVFEQNTPDHFYTWTTSKPGDHYWRVQAVFEEDETSEWTAVNQFIYFVPNFFDDLVLWLAADSLVSTDADGNVSEWGDLSENNNNAVQYDINKQPLISSFFNNNSISFSGNHFLSVTGNDGINPIDFSYFIIGENHGTEIESIISSIIPSWYGFQIRISNDRAIFLKSDGTGSNKTVLSQMNQPWLLLYKNENPNGEIFINNDFIDTHIKNIYYNEITDLTVGKSSAGTDNYFNGEIAEILIYKRSISPLEIDFINGFIQSKYDFVINLGFDIYSNIFCSVEINAGNNFVSYLWSTNETTSLIKIDTEGEYFVKVIDAFGFESSDTIMVSFPDNRVEAASNILCANSSLTLSSTLNPEAAFTYEWFKIEGESSVFVANGHTININEAGDYWVLVEDSEACISASDTISISIDNFPLEYSLGEDKQLCAGNIIEAMPGEDTSGYTFLWSRDADPAFTSDSPFIEVFESDTYYIEITNENGCIATDNIYIEIVGVAPDAQFSSDAEVCAESPLQFTDLSSIEGGEQITEWHWDFGDGNTSTEQHPEHIYTEPGIKNVVLTVTTDAGCSNFYGSEIEVLPIPQADFSVSEICVGYPAYFFDESIAPENTEIISWYWDFGDGNTSNEQNPEHTFSESATIKIELAVNLDNGCFNSAELPLEFPEFLPLPNDFTLIYPKNNQIVSDKTVQYSWNISDNASIYVLEIAEDVNFENIIYEHETFQQSHTASLPDNDNIFWRVKAFNACRDSLVSHVNSLKIFNPALVDDLVLWLAADSLVISNEDGRISQWTDLSGNNNHASQFDNFNKPELSLLLENKEVIDFKGNNYLTIQSNTQINPINFSYIILGVKRNNPLQAVISSVVPSWYGMQIRLSNESAFFFKGSGGGSNHSVDHIMTKPWIISYLNNNSNGSIYINNTFKDTHNQSISYANPSDLFIGRSSSGTITYYDGLLGEIIMFNRMIHLEELNVINEYLRHKYAPPINLGADIRIANGFCPVTIDAGERFETYLWNTGETNQSIEVNEPGIYGVTVVDIFGFESSDSLEVRYPEVYIAQNDTLICYGDQVVLDVSGDILDSYSYMWFKDGVEISTEQSIEAGEEGLYQLRVYDENDCYLPLEMELSVDMFSETTTLGDDRPFCMGDELEVMFGNRYPKPDTRNLSYIWNTGATTPTITITEPGEYYVTVINEIGCVAQDTVSLSLQGNAPVVELGYDEVCYGETVSFTENSSVEDSEIISWFWEFNDPGIAGGGTSNEPEPSHTYTTAGIFDVSLSITSEAGCTSEKTEQVQVYHLPEPAFSPLNACHNIEIGFSDLSSSIDGIVNQWHWSFINPENQLAFESTEELPVFTFNEPGNWNISMEVTTDKACTNSISREITIRESADIDFDYSAACLGEPVQFTNLTSGPAWTTITSLEWEFGDGSSSAQNNPTHLYIEDGTYEVTLTVHSINGCTISLTKEILVSSIPEVDFETPLFCVNTAHVFQDLSFVPSGEEITAWHWDFGNGQTSTEQYPVVVYEEPGQYEVSLMVESSVDCIGEQSKLVDVFPSPESDFAFYPRYGVSPLTVSFTNNTEGAEIYYWDFGDGSTGSTQANPQHIYTENGVYEPMLIAYSNLGCMDTTISEIKVIPLNIDIAVTEVIIEEASGHLKVTAALMNLGTLDLDSVYLDLVPAGSRPVRETWTGLLRAGDFEYYTFNAQIPDYTGKDYDYICVEASIPFHNPDDNPDNNYKCQPLEEEFTVIPPYPNPANNTLNTGFIIPYRDHVKVEIFDLNGNSIGTLFNDTADIGFTYLQHDISNLRGGVYFVRVVFRDGTVVKRFVKL